MKIQLNCIKLEDNNVNIEVEDREGQIHYLLAPHRHGHESDGGL